VDHERREIAHVDDLNGIVWRGFLSRWLKSPNWEQVPLGDFSKGSFWGVVVLFALAHPEWLAAASYSAMLNGLLMWKRDLWNCIVAHAVSNMLLAVYILKTEAWWLW
jgi:CAAX prenyl protease-like protein